MKNQKEIGRPTKYSEEMMKKAKLYVARCQKEEKIPYIEELALILGINDDTIVEWSKIHKDFSATMKDLRMLQKLRIQDGSLNKQLQPSTSIFMLKSNHGMSDDHPRSREPIEFVITL